MQSIDDNDVSKKRTLTVPVLDLENLRTQSWQLSGVGLNDLEVQYVIIITDDLFLSVTQKSTSISQIATLHICIAPQFL